MCQNDASAGLQPRCISALEVQGSDGVVADLLDGNAAEGLEVRLVDDGDEELGSVRICEAIVPDIHLFDKMISRGRAPADEQHSASSCVSVMYIHMHTATTSHDTHIAQNAHKRQIKLAAKF